jgi:RES domain-containing protein
MPVIPGLTTTIRAGQPYYRITSRTFRAPNRARHREVVNGAGGILSRDGARYNYPGARTVYLAEDPATCLAERMFYFHREVLSQLDAYHRTGILPAFQQSRVLWEVRFKKDVPDVFELSLANASAMNSFPTLMLNPSQDYEHLKDRRAAIQSNGYQGLRAPSSRIRETGHMIVLFEDQSKNVHTIIPHEVEFRLITAGDLPEPFTNHAVDLLDFTAGEVRVRLASGSQAPHPTLAACQDWTRFEFNH